jgi:energy-coupling factor transporter ATP-binding protein EcfA2
MADIADITGLPRGARFFRADLHIHTVAGSHDVKDATATPEAIVTTAAKEGLKIIAITDHNEIEGVGPALAAAIAANIFVVPAVELSTSEGHLLCYLPSLEKLQRFHAQLSIVDRGTQDSRCQNAILDCLEKLAALDGFGILAHVDTPGGFETEVPGSSPHKLDVLCHRALLGIELKNAKSPIAYSDEDPDAGRARVGQERIQRLGLGTHQKLARVLNSDAHSLQALGRNASGDRRVTRYKMNALSFESLRIALDDAGARVRIEDEIPPAVPFIKGIRMSGGFLDGQCIHFGPNLNCIIGGRGTGKSTTFEAMRCLAGHPSESSVIDSDVWANQIDLLIEDQAGQVHHLTRARGGEVENADNPLDGPVTFPIECYGQGETQQISQRAQTDPAALLDYLDRFVDIRDESEREAELRQSLLELQTKIEEANRKVDLIPQYERDLNLAQSQIQALEKAKAREIIDLQRKVEGERQVRQVISTAAQAITRGTTQQDLKTNIATLKSAADPKALVVGGNEFSAIAAQAGSFESSIASAEAAIKGGAATLSSVVTTQLAAWRAKEQGILKQIDDKKRELEAQGIRVDMAYIQKLATDEAKLKQEVETLKKWKPFLDDLWKQRREALRERWTMRARIAMKRSAFGNKASSALKAALGDLHVTLKFDESAYSPEANNIIVETMGWRTQQVPRASALTEKLTVPKLLDALARKDTAPLQALTTEEGVTIFSKADAALVLEKLAPNTVRFRLERAEIFDRPRLTVTKIVTASDGKKHPRIRDFRQLSLGQQQSVLLAVMLSADTNTPLIIDQPEDNLDGEFIYQSIIPVLRRVKERRQVIVVTHNANIAVLGDAEQIIVLRATNEQGVIVSRGSIDDPETRESSCALLEGSREAFQRRARIYGSAGARPVATSQSSPPPASVQTIGPRRASG